MGAKSRKGSRLGWLWWMMFNEFDVHGLDVTRGLYYYKATYLNYITIYIYIERERHIVCVGMMQSQFYPPFPDFCHYPYQPPGRKATLQTTDQWVGCLLIEKIWENSFAGVSANAPSNWIALYSWVMDQKCLWSDNRFVQQSKSYATTSISGLILINIHLLMYFYKIFINIRPLCEPFLTQFFGTFQQCGAP